MRGKDGKASTSWALRAAQDILQVCCRVAWRPWRSRVVPVLSRLPGHAQLPHCISPQRCAVNTLHLALTNVCSCTCAPSPFFPPQESFDPIMDLGSNTDLLPVMLYARRAGEWDYSNCLTLLLRHKVRVRVECVLALHTPGVVEWWGSASGATANIPSHTSACVAGASTRPPIPPHSFLFNQGKPVVAAICRVFGPQMAELPLIATKNTARRQGHARILVDCFQDMLRQVGASPCASVVLPALHVPEGVRPGCHQWPLTTSPPPPMLSTSAPSPAAHPRQAGVHTLVLPAAHETVETWKNGFQFLDMPEDDVRWAGPVVTGAQGMGQGWGCSADWSGTLSFAAGFPGRDKVASPSNRFTGLHSH